ncbi:hypothetical protein N9917_00030 [Deltaproteobacteria bacterium]|nr:hypothetical protein [Deltaproteobacteria bacterium]
MIDPLYYRNRANAVAVSVDDGETVIIPLGRELPWREVWEEVDGDLRAELSEAQERAVVIAEKEDWAKPQPIWRDDKDVAAVLDSLGSTAVIPNPDLEDLWESLK